MTPQKKHKAWCTIKATSQGRQVVEFKQDDGLIQRNEVLPRLIMKPSLSYYCSWWLAGGVSGREPML